MLDGLSYLTWRGICHLDVQPSNVVVTSTKRVDVKLVDFGSAQHVNRQGSACSPRGMLDYTGMLTTINHENSIKNYTFFRDITLLSIQSLYN